MNADRAKAKDQSLMVKQFNGSTIQQFFALLTQIRLYLLPIKPLLFFAT
jgi:hypothetical protein